MRELSFTVPDEFDGARTEAFLKHLGISRRLIIAMKQSGGIMRGREVLRTVDVIHAGEKISLTLPDGCGTISPNERLSAEIVYEDDDVVIFDKPPFMPVHPSQRHYDDTLANVFAAKFPGIPFRPVNRLDKNTSGLCVCAKNRLAAAALSGTLEKVYYAVTDGTPPGDTIDAPIGRADGSVIERCVTPDGKPAVTHFTKLGGARRSLLRVTLETGRTHQIRVHFAHIGFPLCGDDMYGGDCSCIARQALHCGEVRFLQPIGGDSVEVKSPLPEDMKRLLAPTGE